MIGIFSDSIARAGGISSDNDVRVRQAIQRNLSVDAVEVPENVAITTTPQRRSLDRNPWRFGGFLQLSTNRFLI